MKRDTDCLTAENKPGLPGDKISGKSRNLWYNSVIMHGFLILMAVIFLIPFYIAIVNAFKPGNEIMLSPLSLPLKHFTLENLIRNIQSQDFSLLIAYSTSATLAFLTDVFVVLVAAMMSYIICRKNNRFYKITYLLLLAGLMIPAQVILLPNIMILRTLGLMFTIPGLILMYIGWNLPFAVFTLTGYIGTISCEIDESARIDGADDLVIFFKMIFPLIKPAVASVVIFITLWTWNDFVNPLIILSSSRFYPVTLGVYRAIGQYTQKWDDVFAIVFLAIFPVIVFYLLMQKSFVSGLTTGALKG